MPQTRPSHAYFRCLHAKKTKNIKVFKSFRCDNIVKHFRCKISAPLAIQHGLLVNVFFFIVVRSCDDCIVNIP
jgi:hypothetical protein